MATPDLAIHLAYSDDPIKSVCQNQSKTSTVIEESRAAVLNPKQWKWSTKTSGVKSLVFDPAAATVTFKVTKVGESQPLILLDKVFLPFTSSASQFLSSEVRAVIDDNGIEHVRRLINLMEVGAKHKLIMPAGAHLMGPDALEWDIELLNLYRRTECWPSGITETPKLHVFLDESRGSPTRLASVLSIVEMDYTLTDDDGVVLVDTRAKKLPHRFTIGCGDVPLALESAAVSLPVGGRAVLYVEPEAFMGPLLESKEHQRAFRKTGKGGIPFLCLKKESAAIANELFTGVVENMKINRDEISPGSILETAPIDSAIPMAHHVRSNYDLTQFMTTHQGKRAIFKDVEILRVLKLKDGWAFSPRGGILLAYWYRVTARHLFRMNDYVRAGECYDWVELILNRYCDRANLGACEDVMLNKINQAIVFFKLEEYRLAQAKLTEVLKANQEQVKAVYWMGRVHEVHEDYGAAEEYYRRCLRTDPANVAAKRRLAVMKAKDERDMVLARKLLTAADFDRVVPPPQETILDFESSLSIHEPMDDQLLEQFGIRQIDSYQVEEACSELDENRTDDKEVDN